MIDGKHNPTMGGKLRPAIDMARPFRLNVGDGEDAISSRTT